MYYKNGDSMKVLFISDIHGNYDNLDILEKFEFDKLIVLGDVFSYYNNDANDKIINTLKKYPNVLWIKGNCDYDSMYEKYNISYINDYLFLKIDDINIYCTHGNRYNFSRGFFFEENGVIIYGHEHIPYIEKSNGNVYICVGSISNPRFGSKPSFCFYENKTFTLYSNDFMEINKISF